MTDFQIVCVLYGTPFDLIPLGSVRSGRHEMKRNSELILLFLLQDYLNSDSAFARSTVVTAVKFTISDQVRDSVNSSTCYQ